MPIDHRYDHNGKAYVDVTAVFHRDGVPVHGTLMMVEPLSFVWEDGKEYEIAKVTDIQQAASFKAGGAGLRYTVIIENKEKYIWLEDSERWFMERKN